MEAASHWVNPLTRPGVLVLLYQSPNPGAARLQGLVEVALGKASAWHCWSSEGPCRPETQAACRPPGPAPSLCILYLKWRVQQRQVRKPRFRHTGKPGSETHTPAWLGWGEQLVKSTDFRVAEGQRRLSLTGRGALSSWWLCLVLGL